MTLGMENIANTNYRNSVCRAFSLVVGLVLGVFLSQGLAALTAKLFQVKLKSFQFVFSTPSMLKTILYFGIAFLLVMAFNAYAVGRQKLIDLIYAERKNEKYKTPSLVLSVFLFLVSILCLVAAYRQVLVNEAFKTSDQFMAAVAFARMGSFFRTIIPIKKPMRI